MKKIVIPLPPVTKKNHQRIVRGRYGAPMVIPSAQYEAYQQAAAWHCKGGETIAEPVEVKCLFYMPTRRKVDLTNLLEAIDDILVYAGTLADDNSSIIVSHDGSRVLYDKDNPRTEVYITKYQEETKTGGKRKRGSSAAKCMRTGHPTPTLKPRRNSRRLRASSPGG